MSRKNPELSQPEIMEREVAKAVKRAERIAGRCNAKLKSGNPCRKYPMHGQSRCELHGGKAPQNLVKAQERLAIAKASTILARMENPPSVGHPLRALEQLAGEAMTLVESLRTAITTLEHIRYESEEGSEQIRGEVQAYMAMMARAESILTKMLTLKLEERRQRLEEQQSQLVADAIRRILEDLKVKMDAETAAIVQRRLGAIDSTAEEIT